MEAYDVELREVSEELDRCKAVLEAAHAAVERAEARFVTVRDRVRMREERASAASKRSVESFKPREGGVVSLADFEEDGVRAAIATDSVPVRLMD